jgi:endonuclease YncB( thermonuclease family)
MKMKFPICAVLTLVTAVSAAQGKLSDIRTIQVHVAPSPMADEAAVEEETRALLGKYLPSIRATKEYSDVNLLVHLRETANEDGSVHYAHSVRLFGNGSDRYGLHEKVYWTKTVDGTVDSGRYEAAWQKNLKRLVKDLGEAFSEEATIRAEVISVADGDTLSVFSRGETETLYTVRLHNVDCPESGQPFGPEARAFTAERVLGQTVTVRVEEVDRYGRVLGEVLLPDGKSLNRELIQSGMAWWYNKYSKDSALASLEAQAEAKGTGLWADPNPTPPWEYRKEKK